MTRIYLGDLTHTTITISNDSFPLNVGLVAAYARKCFPEVEIELFKYPEDLRAAIDRAPPDIIGLSNYPWNQRLDSSFLEYARRINPRVVTVMGGPNISYLSDEQEAFLRELEGRLDFYVMHEGESGFAELLGALINAGFDASRVKAQGVRGSIYLRDGRFSGYTPIPRNQKLDEYPSPYLTGFFDKFFDGKLSPMIETHRGCPFHCTYCHEGHDSYNKVNRFSLERILGELHYIGAHIGPSVKNLLIADPNFGMFDRDIEIAAKLNDLSRKHGFPKSVFATTAKNSSKKLVSITQQLDDVTLPIWMSVQSMAPEVLQNIKRKNISIQDMLDTQAKLESHGAVSKSELIIPLPGETLESHLDALVRLIGLGISQIVCYQLMMVNGSELKMDHATRLANRFETRFRVLPRNFTQLDGMERAIEREEIVISTRDFSFTDYLKARKYHLLVTIFYNGNVLKGLFRLAQEAQVDVKPLLKAMLEEFEADAALGPLLAAFMRDTEQELFETEAAIDAHYRDEGNYSRLLQGENGANLLQKYSSTCYLQHGAQMVNAMARALMRCLDDSWHERIANVARHYELSFDKFLAPDRLMNPSSGLFRYDVTAWLSSADPIEAHAWPKNKKIWFHTPVVQHDMVESYFSRYGRDAQAMGKILTRIWISDMLRKPVATPPSEGRHT